MLSNWLNGKWTALTPLIAVAILVLFYVAFNGAFISCNKRFRVACEFVNVENILPNDKPEPIGFYLADNNESNRKIIAKRYNGRISWTFLMAAYMLLSAVAFVVSIILTSQSFVNWGKRPTIGVVTLILLTALSVVLLLVSKDIYMPLLAKLLEKTVQVDVTNIVQIANSVNSIGLAAAFSLVLASCAVLLPTTQKGIVALKQLSTKMTYMRAVLYVGTLMLVSGVLLMTGLFSWSKTFISQTEANLEIVDTFTSGVLNTSGALYTLILAAVYLPAAFILRERARSLTVKDEDAAEKERLLQDSNLTFSFRESLPRVAAIIAPMLAGPVGELFSRLPQ